MGRIPPVAAALPSGASGPNPRLHERYIALYRTSPTLARDRDEPVRYAPGTSTNVHRPRLAVGSRRQKPEFQIPTSGWEPGVMQSGSASR